LSEILLSSSWPRAR